MELDRREQIVVKGRVDATSSTLCELPGLSARSAAELTVEVGDPARFTAGGFARFNGTPDAVSTRGRSRSSPAAMAGVVNELRADHPLRADPWAPLLHSGP